VVYLGLYFFVCWSDGYVVWCYVLLRFSFVLVCMCCFSVVVWCVSTAGGVFVCSGVTVCPVTLVFKF
jgi:hypothetical protein